MKKVLIAILALILTVSFGVAEEGRIDIPFATIGEAKAAEGYTGLAGSDEQHYVAIVKVGDDYIRLVTELDEKAYELGFAPITFDSAEAQEAATRAYNDYCDALPVAYAEIITAQPMSREEMDALAGKTLLELEEAGYEHGATGTNINDEVIYTVTYGMYDYDLLLDANSAEYREHDSNGYIGDLTVKSASVAGLSRNAVELRYHADGTYDKEKDSWGEFNEIMDMINSALSSDDPDEALRMLMEAAPDKADEIKALAELISALGGTAEETESGNNE